MIKREEKCFLELNATSTGYGCRVEGCSWHPVGKPPTPVTEPMHLSSGSGNMYRRIRRIPAKHDGHIASCGKACDIHLVLGHIA